MAAVMASILVFLRCVVAAIWYIAGTAQPRNELLRNSLPFGR